RVQGIRKRDSRRLQGTERTAGHRIATAAQERESELSRRQEHARQASAQGHAVRVAGAIFRGNHRRRVHGGGSGWAGEDVDDLRQDGADELDKARRRARSGDQADRGDRSRGAAREAGAVRQVAVRAAGADGPDRQRVECGAPRLDERAGAAGEEEKRGIGNGYGGPTNWNTKQIVVEVQPSGQKGAEARGVGGGGPHEGGKSNN